MSQRSTQLREWAAAHLTVVEHPGDDTTGTGNGTGNGPASGPARGLSQGQLAAAQKATRPRKPESISWPELRAGRRGFGVSRDAQRQALDARERAAQRAAARATRTGVVVDRRVVAAMAARADKAALTRADLVEVIGAHLPLLAHDVAGPAGNGDRGAEQGAVLPRQLIEAAVDAVAMRLAGPRLAHQREGSERFTVDLILAEERAVFDLVDTAEIRAVAWVRPEHTAAALGLSEQQHRVVTAIATTPQLVVPLSAPAGAGKTTSMRALRTIVETRRTARTIVIAPTGKAVDVALADGAASEGYTVHDALKRLAEGRLELGPFDVIIVDEAGMVGTQHWLRLLTHTTAAGAKTVLVGDAHQLEPVKARGGMFAQLCDDLPWTRKLSEVWRQRDPAERAASLALRDGGPAPVRRAVGWYRQHDRLHCGDVVTMASDALHAHQKDVAARRNSLLLADTVETCDALNRRIHDRTLEQRTAAGRDTTTVTAARGHRIGVADVVLSRRNDPSVAVYDPAERTRRIDGAPVRNGQRWQVLKVDDTAEHPRIAARRLGDGAITVFEGDYLRQHVQLGHAVTVHAAQGVTAERVHAVIADTATRNLAYVALTRGRDANHAYLYERTSGEADHHHRDLPDRQEGEEGVHLAQRGTASQAGRALRQILGRDEPARTAHRTAADTPTHLLPDRVASLITGYRQTVDARWTAHRRTQRAQRDRDIDRTLGLHHNRDRGREQERGYDLGL